MVVGTVSRITLHVKVNMDMSHQYTWLIPSDGYLMLKQTQWEVVVQMVWRSCIFLVQKRANTTFIWAFSLYVVLGQLSVPAHKLGDACTFRLS